MVETRYIQITCSGVRLKKSVVFPRWRRIDNFWKRCEGASSAPYCLLVRATSCQPLSDSTAGGMKVMPFWQQASANGLTILSWATIRLWAADRSLVGTMYISHRSALEGIDHRHIQCGVLAPAPGGDQGVCGAPTRHCWWAGGSRY